MNHFSDQNPYESPIVAELNEPNYQPPRRKQPFPVGKFVLLGLILFTIATGLGAATSPVKADYELHLLLSVCGGGLAAIVGYALATASKT